MTEQLRNGYDDDDLRQILEEIEGFEDEKLSVRAEAAGKCSQISKRIANAKKTATNLGIPKASLNALLKMRKLERQMQDVAGGVPEDEVEVFEDMTGQFSFLAPDTPDETAAQVAARKRSAAVEANEDAEQEEGAAVLEGAVH
jgi:hypothetical protein